MLSVASKQFEVRKINESVERMQKIIDATNLAYRECEKNLMLDISNGIYSPFQA